MAKICICRFDLSLRKCCFGIRRYLQFGPAVSKDGNALSVYATADTAVNIVRLLVSAVAAVSYPVRASIPPGKYSWKFGSGGGGELGPSCCLSHLLNAPLAPAPR